MGVFVVSGVTELIIRYTALLLPGTEAKLKTHGISAAHREAFIGNFHSLYTPWIRKWIMSPELSA